MALHINKGSLERILQLNDDQLRGLIYKMASSRGIPTAGIKLGEEELKVLRTALASASEQELGEVVDQLSRKMQQGNLTGSDDGQ